MASPEEIKKKILSFLRIKGPGLPVQIARETQTNSLFAGAFLSELASDKSIRISNMKVGGSPLYFLPGQEQQLENFSNHLPSKEKEAYLLLKKRKILRDIKQKPAIRVALRNIKDFAFPFSVNLDGEQKIFWRFHNLPEQEARNLLVPKTAVKAEKKKEIKTQKREIEKPLLEIKEKPKPKPVKEKSYFVSSITRLLERENIEITEEKESKKREYQATIRINSDVGKLALLLIAKDKKSITENDLRIATQKAQSARMPALFISPGELNRRAQAYLEQYSGLVMFKKLHKE